MRSVDFSEFIDLALVFTLCLALGLLLGALTHNASVPVRLPAQGLFPVDSPEQQAPQR